MAAAPSIPDDLIYEILVRLPATAVLRSRAVCKQWRALVDDHRFLSAHHQRRPPMPLLLLRHDDPPDHPTRPRHFRVRLEAIDLLAAGATQPVITFTAPARRDHRKRFPRNRIIGVPELLFRDEGEFRVHGSCDGVLLVSYKRQPYLCNPARRRWTLVSTLTLAGLVGFYAHRPSGLFRLLHLHRRSTDDIDYGYQIETLRQQKAPIGSLAVGPFYNVLRATIRVRAASESPPALVAGSLHWLPHPDSSSSSSNSSDLLVFDTVSETFRRMRPPSPAGGQAQALLELDGKLTMTLTRAGMGTAELWVLRDYEREDSWACELQVPLPPAPGIVHGRPGAVAIVSSEGDVVIQCADCVLQCDARGRVRARHQAEHHRNMAVLHMFRESLVPHCCVTDRHLRTGYEGIQYPPFFIDCNCPLHSEL